MKCPCGTTHRSGKCQFNQDPEKRMEHNRLTAEINRNRRSDPEVRKIINERNNEARRRKMQDPEYRARANAIARKRLEDPEKYKRKLETNNACYRRIKEKHSEKTKSIEQKSRPRKISNAYTRTQNNSYYHKLKEKHPDKYIARLQHVSIIGKKIRDRDRLAGIKQYGGVCTCCGESHIEFLGIDHTNGGGNKHRKEIKGAQIYKWLRQNKYPPGFRVMCHNCNMSLGFYGYCPHKTDRMQSAKQD